VTEGSDPSGSDPAPTEAHAERALTVDPTPANEDPSSEPERPAADPTADPAPAIGDATTESAPTADDAAMPSIPVPAVESTRRLLGASFDLLTRASDDMRRASFYIGIVTLCTVGPIALASWAVEVAAVHLTNRQLRAVLGDTADGPLGLLGLLAGLGVIVATVESRAMAAAILGGRLAVRPISARSAPARSRMVFWRVIIGSLIVGVPVLAVQRAIQAAFDVVLGPAADVSIVSSTLTAAIVGAPLAYLLSGIVLGDVAPVEATRRSFRVFRARPAAAILVAVFETIAILLVVLGLGAGLDLALRVFGALGLGPGSGPIGLAIVTLGVMAGVFALGTLIYTAFAISIAPQVVMFIGLTRASFGLDHVRPGGDHDPTVRRSGQRRFRWLTIPMVIGLAAGVIGLVTFARTLTE
jgi:hypothetical protein